MSSDASPRKEAPTEVGLVRRYCTALARHHRSRGFGIHSPSAYRFVTQVLRERCPYYAYDDMGTLRKALLASGARDLISDHDARLLFRIVNHFTPRHILLVGAGDTLTIASLLQPSSQTTVYACGEANHLDHLSDLARRVVFSTRLDTTLTDYNTAQPEPPFIIINELTGGDTMLQPQLTQWLQGEAVVIMRNLNHNPAINRLWQAASQAMPHGHTFTNGKTAILVARPKIPLQHFEIWL